MGQPNPTHHTGIENAILTLVSVSDTRFRLRSGGQNCVLGRSRSRNIGLGLGLQLGYGWSSTPARG